MVKNALYILSDNDRLKEFKSNAKKEAMKFGIDTIVPQYEKIYEQTLTKCLTLK
jgi:glycogen synthase